MISKAMQEGINEQIKQEINSAYLYLSMSMYATSSNLPGFSSWLKLQWQEELTHALKLAEIVQDRGGKVVLQSVDKPPADFKSPLELFHQVLSHEQKVTSLINKLYETAVKEDDYSTQVELQWFIKEQVEEEKNAGTIVEQLRLAGESGPALMMVDRVLAMRAAR
ncbi:MAG TPA: ferritin [Bacteroidota bacterium]|nr:ferritin [Bacteroidota bacterium]